MQLMQANNVDIRPGCLILFLDLIFFVWILTTLVAFSPQMALDGARFSWVRDITHYDFSIIPLFIAVAVLNALTIGPGQFGQSAGQIVVGSAISGLLLWVAAWYFEWPVYVFILWMVLSLLGLLIQLAMRVFLKVAS